MTSSASMEAMILGQDLQRRALARHRWLATGLLLAMAAVLLATRLVPDPQFATLLVRAGAEAALVGGLADWFAVTALFRHPLGLPIPHTAIVPRGKDRIGEGLGLFVERNFLDPDLVAKRLGSLDISGRVARWLADPAAARALAGRLAGALPQVLDSVSDRQLRSFFAHALREQLDRLDLAPVLGKGLGLLRENDHHQALFEFLLRAARDYLEAEQHRIYEAVERRSEWWVPKTVDRRIAQALIDGVIGLLDDLSDPDHDLRRRCDAAFEQLIEELKHGPEMAEKVRKLKDDILANPQTQTYLAALWDDLRARVLRQAEDEDSQLRAILARAAQSVGASLLRDSRSSERLNGWIERLAREFVVPWRHEIGDFIADVVRGWDGRDVAERIELAVGRDLQYIRMNGTLVGALVGCLLFLLSEWVF